jgi:hypothetical protein
VLRWPQSSLCKRAGVPGYSPPVHTGLSPGPAPVSDQGKRY